MDAASTDRPPELRMTRIFDAPKQLVFEAWTKAGRKLGRGALRPSRPRVAERGHRDRDRRATHASGYF
jgi:hypothetical protein